MLARWRTRSRRCVRARRGHFQMESGYHSATWFELGSLFDHPDELRPFTDRPGAAPCGARPGCRVRADDRRREVSAADRCRTLSIECFEAERPETPGATGLFPVKYELPESAAGQSARRGRSRSSTMRSARARPFAGRTRTWSRAARGPSRSARSSCSATRRRGSRRTEASRSKPSRGCRSRCGLPPSARSARRASRSTRSAPADHRRRSSDRPSPLAISSKPSAFTASTSARCFARSRFTVGAA